MVVEQRIADGFINGTAMCKAHGKLIPDWFRNQETVDLLYGLANDLGIEVNYEISDNLSIARVSAAFPTFFVTRRGAPEVGGGTWVHPDLAIRLAMWCNTPFSIQVIRWVREWMTIAYNNEAERKKQEQEARYNQRVIQACVTPIASPMSQGLSC